MNAPGVGAPGFHLERIPTPSTTFAAGLDEPTTGRAAALTARRALVDGRAFSEARLLVELALSDLRLAADPDGRHPL